MSKTIRKRKQISQDKGDTAPKQSKTVRDEEMIAEEEELTKILFGGSESFLRSLEEAEKEPAYKIDNNLDSGLGETDSDDSQSNRKPAWVDEDDDGIDVGSALDVQGRKLPDGGVNSRLNQYSNLLKRKYLKIVGTPAWADLDKKYTRNDDSDDELMQTTGFLKKQGKVNLPGDNIQVKKVKDLNCETYMEGPYINAIEFHPTSSVALVAGNSGNASLFSVDGKNNNKLHSVWLQNYQILSAKFAKNGNEAILGSRNKYVYIYDLMAAKTVKKYLPRDITSFKQFAMSPNGKLIAVIGKSNGIHILSSVSLEQLYELTQHSQVTAIAFNHDGSLLYGHSDTGEVHVWDMNMQRVKHKWIDDGCLQGSAISLTSSNQFLATGSAQGVVNLYDVQDIMSNNAPQPIKRIMNLTTEIKNVNFNPTSEILAFGSAELTNAFKLLHIGTKSVFQNFPNLKQQLDYVNVVNFSPNSGYMAIGNRKSVVALYRLKHYNNY